MGYWANSLVSPSLHVLISKMKISETAPSTLKVQRADVLTACSVSLPTCLRADADKMLTRVTSGQWDSVHLPGEKGHAAQSSGL